MKKVGSFTKTVIDALSLDIEEGTPIYIGPNNEQHIKDRHPVEYDLYFHRIDVILSEPDYVRNNTKNNSVDFVKVFRFGDDYIQASVRVDKKGTHYVRTLFQMMSFKVERYISNGDLVKIS